jgi:hypothetical protein
MRLRLFSSIPPRPFATTKLTIGKSSHPLSFYLNSYHKIWWGVK